MEYNVKYINNQPNLIKYYLSSCWFFYSHEVVKLE